MTNSKFEIRSLIIIVPFAAAFLLGILCICRHKIFLWGLKKDDSESDIAGPKIDPKNVKKGSLNAEKYAAPADAECGNGRPESESDSILTAQSGKGGRKSLCA